MYNREWHRAYYRKNKSRINAYLNEYFKKGRSIDPNYQRENRKIYAANYGKGRYFRDSRLRQRLKVSLEKRLNKINELRTRPCLDCGKTYPPYVMEFDHRDPNEKSTNVTNPYLGEKKFNEELEKCDVVCANCHRVRTHKQRLAGFFKREGIQVDPISTSNPQIELRLEA